MNMITSLLIGAVSAAMLEPADEKPEMTTVEVVRVQSQEECEEGLVFNQEACTCFSLAQCRKLCPEGQILDPRETCTCISEAKYEAIFNHGLDDQCQFSGNAVEADGKSVNIFNFYGPFYGNVVGLGLKDDESCTSSEPDSEYDHDIIAFHSEYAKAKLDPRVPQVLVDDVILPATHYPRIDPQPVAPYPLIDPQPVTHYPLIEPEPYRGYDHYDSLVIPQPTPKPDLYPGNVTPKQVHHTAHHQFGQDIIAASYPPSALAQEGQVCRGWNKETSSPFPNCDEGLYCVFRGEKAPLGQENICKPSGIRKKHQRKESSPKISSLISILCEDGSTVECTAGLWGCEDYSPYYCGLSDSEKLEKEVFQEGNDPFITFKNILHSAPVE